MTINEILKTSTKELNKLTEKELKILTLPLVSAANKRIARFVAKGMQSPALESAWRSGGRFSIKGKNINELRSEFIRVKNFLNSETSTLRGYKKSLVNIKTALANRGVSIEVSDIDKLFRIFEELKEVDEDIANQNLKYKMLDEISIRIERGMTPNDIFNELSGRIEEIYAKNEVTANDVFLSQFFDFGSF